MADHPPAARRAIIRKLKKGEHPSGLIKDARGIKDPGHASAALLAIAGDDRLPAKKSAQLLRDATKILAQVDRPARMAEVLSDCLRLASEMQRGPEVDTAKELLVEACVATIEGMPDGQWTTDTIAACAPHLPKEPLVRLLRRALRNRGGETAAGKALLDQDASLAEIVKAEASPSAAARILGRVADDAASAAPAIAAAWSIHEMADRREALRVLIWQTEDADALDAFARSAKGKPNDDRAAVLTMVAARADRLNLDASKYFGAATAAVKALSGAPAQKAQRKLAAAMEKAGLDPVAVEDAPAPTVSAPEETVDVEVTPGRNHVLALVDGYTGGLGAPHLRAVARAAPLCIAFDLDLALVGFPTQSEETIVSLVEAETNVGEDAGYAQQLLDAGRLTCIPLEHGVPSAWPGTPIATTPHPAEGKDCALEGVPGPICLLLGLGKQGLPKRTLNAVPYHHELTGKGISMETATAMGILADRLGRVPK